MARITIRVHKLVVAVCMARLTGRCYVRSRQCEFRRAMIEGSGLPDVRRMTRFTGMTESSRYVVWIRGLREIRRVT
jgi:hypothetical protein